MRLKLSVWTTSYRETTQNSGLIGKDPQKRVQVVTKSEKSRSVLSGVRERNKKKGVFNCVRCCLVVKKASREG